MTSLLTHVGKRPNNCAKLIEKELVAYLKKEAVLGKYPSKRELMSKFHLRFDTPIRDLYISAGLVYKLAPNQNLKFLKANMLLKIIVNNLDKFGLRLSEYRGVNEHGIDILAKQGSKRIGLELKAYNKYEMLKIKDLKQVNRFLIQEYLDSIILITTTDKLDKRIRSNNLIKIICYSDLLKILGANEITKLTFIQNESVNQDNPLKEIKRQEILQFVNNKYQKENKKPGYREIYKELHLDLYTYFNNLYEIYKLLRIPPPLKNMRGKGSANPDFDCINLWKDQFKQYILEEIKMGHKYPSGEDITRHFNIPYVWNITTVSELYVELNLKPYLKRKKRITSALKS